MKTYRLAFLLGILSTSLVGCNNGGGGSTSKVKVTFNGTNCFIRNGLDDKASEFTTLEVEKDSSQTFQIFVKETDKFLIPDSNGVTVTDGVTKYYYPNGKDGGAQGELDFPKIDRDITITATARNRSVVTYSVEYPFDPNANWTGPTEVNSGDQLDATIKITTDTYLITKSDINVRIGNNYFYDDFTFVNNKLTIPAGVINGKVVITGFAHRPSVTYNVDFNVSNAEKGAEFPTVVKEGAALTATFDAKQGYRLPRIIDGDPSHDEFSIHKKGSGVDMALTPFDPDTWNGDFTYRITERDGIEHAEVYIFQGVLVNNNFDTVSFEGDAVEQVTVTFEPGAKEGGHWQNPVSSTESRDGTIDKGKTLQDALAKASGGEQPVKDGEQWSFDKWVDDEGKEYYSPTEIDKSVTVHATFKEKEFTIYKEIYNAEITGLPTEPLHWHDPVGSSLKPIKIQTEEGYKLPAKGLVSVTMNKAGQTTWDDINFHYIRMTDTEADFYIDEDIIEGDIKITLNAEKYVTVTFDPGEGKWKDNTQDKVPVTILVGSTYGEALDLTRKGGNPSKEGAKFFKWENDSGTIITTDKIINESDNGKTITAYYTAITTFANDTWENVIAHANAGDLKTAYGDTIYIGATREVTWANEPKTVTKTYTVRVIDSNYDYYYTDDTHEKTAASALTFEFVDLVGEGIYGKMPGTLPGTYVGKNSWYDSTYRTFLEEFYEGIQRGTPDFTVKPAIKYTLRGYVAPSENIDPRDQYETINNFFPLSGAEINIADDNKYTNNTTYSPDQRSNEALPVSGGLPYYYYQSQAASRLKKLDGVVTSYWLRSPHAYKEDGIQDPDKPDTSEAYWIDLTSGESSKTGSPTDYNGGRGGSSTCDNSRGYMAAFCI